MLLVVFAPIILGLVVAFAYPYFMTPSNHKAASVLSSDKLYSIDIQTNNNGILELHIYRDNKKLIVLNTRASIYQKYAIGWKHQENIIVMYSSDIGTRAWSVIGIKVTKVKTKEHEKYAKELYNKKYS